MDPLLGTAVNAGVATLAKQAPSAGRFLVRRARLLGTIEPGLLKFPDLELTAGQAADLHAFLESADCRALVSVLATSLLSGSSQPDETDVLGRTFAGLARRWEGGKRWPSSSDTIWRALCTSLTGHLPHPAELPDYQLEIEEFGAFVRSPLDTKAGASSSKAQFVEKLIDLGARPDQVQKSALFASAVAATHLAGGLQPIITHSDVDQPTDFEALYVPRTLVRAADGKEQDSLDVVSSGRGFRIVLLGNPGAGKTTFVHHVAWTFSGRVSNGEASQTPIILRCRQYAGGAWDQSILEFIRDRVRVELGLENTTEVENGLVLGKYLVVFDGLDEVTETSRRAELVQRIERFTQAFPVSSILVTSREVGYSLAPLGTSTFSQCHLREFSVAQVHNYTSKWFTLRKREDLIAPFMSESGSVADLRSNPLLLSLLCILFRARGVIPRQRREVYERCADLLFHTWDAHRQISSPEEVASYGDQLMQEIAHWVYKSATAQGGIEEQVLRKTVAVRLGDLGISSDDARRRGEEFVDFCAGRGWLLGVLGTTASGARLFGFTHRTFYEFFAAEALSRNVSDVSQLCEFMTKAYSTDATSVVPELLLQAYEHRVNNGAKTAFQEMVRRGVDPALLLRLLNGALLPSYIRSAAFRVIIDTWTDAPHKFHRTGYEALFGLDSHAMAQFASSHLMDARGRRFFAQGWALMVLTGQDQAIAPEIKATADQVGKALADTDTYQDDYSVWNWLALDGWVTPTQSGAPYLAVTLSGRLQAAGVWRATLAGMGWGPSRPGGNAVLDRWNEWLFDGNQIMRSIAIGFAQDLAQNGAQDALALREAGDLNVSFAPGTAGRRVAVAAVSLGLVLAEVTQRPDWFAVHLIDGVDVIADLQEVRAWRRGETPEPPLAVRRRVVEVTRTLPGWMREWIDGKRDLVATRTQVDDAFRPELWRPDAPAIQPHGRGPHRPPFGGPRSTRLRP